MHLSQWVIPYLLISIACIAITSAVWFAVRRPAPSRVLGRAVWQASQAGFAALGAVLAAGCVLAAIATLS